MVIRRRMRQPVQRRLPGVTAHDRARALAQAEDTPPDLAIVDLAMPATHGLDVIRTLEAMSGPAVHVIVVIGHDDVIRQAEAFEAGADGVRRQACGTSELGRRSPPRPHTTARSSRSASSRIASFMDLARFEDPRSSRWSP